MTRFKPRARTGRDGRGELLRHKGYAFQATRPHGARRELLGLKPSDIKFQATRPHGARLRRDL